MFSSFDVRHSGPKIWQSAYCLCFNSLLWFICRWCHQNIQISNFSLDENHFVMASVYSENEFAFDLIMFWILCHGNCSKLPKIHTEWATVNHHVSCSWKCFKHLVESMVPLKAPLCVYVFYGNGMCTMACVPYHTFKWKKL